MYLIDREALKEYAREILSEDNFTNISILKMFDNIIDNAPTVAEDYDTGYQDGLEDGLNDIRPKGEWIYKQIHDYDYWECSNCGELCTEGTPKTMNFCPYCGADMRSENDKRST